MLQIVKIHQATYPFLLLKAGGVPAHHAEQGTDQGPGDSDVLPALGLGSTEQLGQALNPFFRLGAQGVHPVLPVGFSVLAQGSQPAESAGQLRQPQKQRIPILVWGRLRRRSHRLPVRP